MIKVWSMGHGDFVAAETKQEAVQCLADKFNDGVIDENFLEEFIEDPKFLTQAELKEFIYYDDMDDPKSPKRSFAQELENRKVDVFCGSGKKTFPQYFAVNSQYV